MTDYKTINGSAKIRLGDILIVHDDHSKIDYKCIFPTGDSFPVGNICIQGDLINGIIHTDYYRPPYDK